VHPSIYSPWVLPCRRLFFSLKRDRLFASLGRSVFAEDSPFTFESAFRRTSGTTPSGSSLFRSRAHVLPDFFASLPYQEIDNFSPPLFLPSVLKLPGPPTLTELWSFAAFRSQVFALNCPPTCASFSFVKYGSFSCHGHFPDVDQVAFMTDVSLDAYKVVLRVPLHTAYVYAVFTFSGVSHHHFSLCFFFISSVYPRLLTRLVIASFFSRSGFSPSPSFFTTSAWPVSVDIALFGRIRFFDQTNCVFVFSPGLRFFS